MLHPNSNKETPITNSKPTIVPPRIPTYLSLPDAAKKFGLSEKVLTQMIQTGKLEAARLSSGELLVAAQNNGGNDPQTKAEIIAAEFAHLQGKPISASEASRKYSEYYGVPISHVNFIRWKQAGYISVEGHGYRLELDEAEVAYCAKIYAEKYHEYNGQMSGVRVFDENGDPYQLKYREVAELMRAERRARKEQDKGEEGAA